MNFLTIYNGVPVGFCEQALSVPLSPTIVAHKGSILNFFVRSGAGEGNRTLVVSLGSLHSTIELHPQPIVIVLVFFLPLFDMFSFVQIMYKNIEVSPSF